MITMTKKRWIGGVIGGIAIALAVAVPSVLNTRTVSAAETVQTWLDAWVESKVTMNVDAMLACETDDCLLLNPNTNEITASLSRAERKLLYESGWKNIDAVEFSNINVISATETDTTATVITTLHARYWFSEQIQSGDLTYTCHLVKIDNQWLISAWRADIENVVHTPS